MERRRIDFDEIKDWQEYVELHMTATQSKDLKAAIAEGSSVKLMTKDYHTIAEWCGTYGYVMEGRPPERLIKDGL